MSKPKSPQSHLHFDDSKTALQYMRRKVQDLKTDSKDKLEGLKSDINIMINKIYNEVCNTAFNLDPYRIPVHGISNPEIENPMNLFQRQLKIEELSFELSHFKYKQTLDSLMKYGKADQLAVSHRYILNWMHSLEMAINEQQKIFIKRGNIDP